MNSKEKLLCNSCQGLLELINPSLHCKRCFFPKATKNGHACKNCSFKSLYTVSVASAFEYYGPIATLTKQLKYGNKPYLAKSLAGFMAAQFAHLNWPLPDLIVPVPQSFDRFLKRGYNQAELLSLTLSSLLNTPLNSSLKRKSGSVSQAALNKQERLQMSTTHISLKKNQNLQDKIILLVDDVLTTGTTIERCAEALMEGAPNAIYALTACYSGLNFS